MGAYNTLLRRLPGRGRKSFGLATATSTRLYLEDDHLLHVANDRFTESYKRFYFRDIQALTLCKTHAGKWINLVLILAAGFFAILGLLGSYSWDWGGAGWAVLGPLGVLFLALLAVNVVKGPTCLCQLKTAVHAEELPSLNRVKTAQKAFDLLRPEIEAAQGALSTSGPQTVAAEQPLTPTARLAGPPSPSRPLSIIRHEKGRLHEMACYLLLLDCVVTAWDIADGGVGFTLAGMVTAFAVLATTIGALVRQRESDLGGKVRSLTWGILGYQGLMFAFGFVYSIYLTVKFNLRGDNQWELIRVWSSEVADQSSFLYWVQRFSAAASCVLGLTGVALIVGHRRQTKNPPALDPPPPATSAMV